MKTIRIVNNKLPLIEIISQSFKKCFGESNLPLQKSFETVGVEKAEPPSRWIWQWKEDGEVWKNYENLHFLISQKYSLFLKSKKTNQTNPQSILFNSLIDNPKYKSGVQYEIDFSKSEKDHPYRYFIQTNKKTNFKRQTRKFKNPLYSSQLEKQLEYEQQKKQLEQFSSFKSFFILTGLHSSLQNAQQELKSLSLRSIHKQSIKKIKSLPFSKVLSLCAPFSVGVEEEEENLLLIGTKPQRIPFLSFSILFFYCFYILSFIFSFINFFKFFSL